LFIRTLQKLRAVDAGFQQEQVLVVRMAPGVALRGAGIRALYDQLYERFGALPGVQSVSVAMDTPGHGLSMAAGIGLAGRPNDGGDAAPVYHNFVGPRFFQTMGIPILAGRDFEVDDDERTDRRVVISESVARRYFGGEDPLGRQLQTGSAGLQSVTGTATATIVGVVKDVRYESLRAAAPLMLYRASRQEANAPANTFLVRTSEANAETLTPLLLAELRRTAPGVPLPLVVRLDDEIAAVLVEERMLTALSNGIGLLAALLAAIGVYSTVASAVARRRREIGIRIAVGALPNQVTRMIVRDAFGILSCGLVIGLSAALVVGRAAYDTLSSVLFGLSPTDPLVFVASAATICLIGSIAAYLPARRASRIDPVSAIKYE
jgi:predicted permease